MVPFEGRLGIRFTGKGTIAQMPHALLPHSLLPRGLPLERGAGQLLAFARANDQPALPSLGQVLGPTPPRELPVVALLPAGWLLSHHRLRHC